jgi:hypothetical protein
MRGLLFFVVFVLVVAAVLVYQHRREQQRKAIAARVAAASGLVYIDDGSFATNYEFELFLKGRSRHSRYVMRRRDFADSVFDYRYTTGSGKNRRTWRFTCAIVAVPFSAPRLEIGPEGFWSGLGRLIGVRDVEIESPEFNDRYRVSCDDERFAVTLLDQRMITWMLSPESGSGSIRFEFLGTGLLCVSDPLPLEQQPGFLNWAASIRNQLPTVLNDLYPVR